MIQRESIQRKVEVISDYTLCKCYHENPVESNHCDRAICFILEGISLHSDNSIKNQNGTIVNP